MEQHLELREMWRRHGQKCGLISPSSQMRNVSLNLDAIIVLNNFMLIQREMELFLWIIIKEHVKAS